jgi:ABC-type branched-subunit amino acid transport system substrate-binding protein
LLFCLALTCLAAGCSPSAKPEPAWIGHLAPLSGPTREGGETSVRAMEIALEQAVADDFEVKGRRVGVRHVDSATGKARAEAVRLLALNGVCALIVGPGAGDLDEVLAAARSHAAPVIVLDEVAEPPGARPGLVLLGPDPARRGEETAAQLAKREKKKVALLVDGSRPKYRIVADAFERSLKDKGELRRWDVADLKRPDAVSQMKGYEASAVVAAASNEWCLLSRETLRQTFAGTKGAAPAELWYVGDDGSDLLRSPGRQKLHKSEWFVSVAPPADAKSPDLDALRRLADGGVVPREAVLGLDGVRLVLQGLKEAKSFQRDRLAEKLGALETFDSVTGEVKWDGGRPVRPLFAYGGLGDDKK